MLLALIVSLLPSQALAAGMTSIIVFGTSTTNTWPATTSTYFTPPNTFINPTSTEANGKGLWCASGTIKNLTVYVDTAPGAGITRTITVRKGASFGAMSDQSLTCNFTGGSTKTCQDITHSFTIAATDFLDVKMAASNAGVAATGGTITAEFWSDNDGEQCITGMDAGGNPGTGGTNQFNNINGIQAAWNTTVTNQQNVIPTAGAITKSYIAIVTAPGAGKSWTFSLDKNASNQATTAMTIAETDTNCSGASSSCNTTSNIAISAGDRINIRGVGTGTPTASGTQYWSFLFVATTNGQSMMIGSTDNTALGTSTTDFISGCCVTAPPATPTTETNARSVFGPYTSVTLTQFYAFLTTGDPGSGKAYVFTSCRTDSDNCAMSNTGTQTCTITGNGSTGTNCNDSTHVTDTWAYNSGTPDYLRVQIGTDTVAVKAAYGYRCYIAPPAAGGPPIGSLSSMGSGR